jgi:hypothetical protein
MAIPHPAAKVEEERTRRARKEVSTMARVENSNRGFERERYYREHRTERGHKDDGKDGGDRRDW